VGDVRCREVGVCRLVTIHLSLYDVPDTNFGLDMAIIREVSNKNSTVMIDFVKYLQMWSENAK
jgi:predicted nucleotidyltransferase